MDSAFSSWELQKPIGNNGIANNFLNNKNVMYILTKAFRMVPLVANSKLVTQCLWHFMLKMTEPMYCAVITVQLYCVPLK